ncbi:hypothetical protein K501DRAFT_291274 [Backusella circina FSU 941]|nr:hypothetical protein K501DRAFT_291274 [Backusella circina FSU 941]
MVATRKRKQGNQEKTSAKEKEATFKKNTEKDKTSIREKNRWDANTLYKDDNNSVASQDQVISLDSFEAPSIVIPRPKGSPFPDAISPDTLEFLTGLTINNDRDYVRLRRKEYDQMRSDFTDFVSILMEEMYNLDPAIRREEPKMAVYRQNRDLRFTNDKRPYKTNVSAAFSINGRKMAQAGYYISIQPGDKTQICCGLWGPNAAQLANMRRSIQTNADLLRESLSTEAIKEVFEGKSGTELLVSTGKLKVAPKGVDKDHPEIELLRFRNFALERSFTDLEVVSPGFSEKVLDCLDAFVPFVTVINSWI